MESVKLEKKPDGETVISISGGFTASSVALFNQVVDSYPEEHVVRVDMSKTSFVDVSGFCALVSFEKKVKDSGREVLFINPNDKVYNFIQRFPVKKSLLITSEIIPILQPVFS